jgi:hypothetical protein
VLKKPIYFLIIIISGIKKDGLFKYLKSRIDYIILFIYKKVIVDILKLTISDDEKNQMELESLSYKFAGLDDQVFLYDHCAITNAKLKNIFQTICRKLADQDMKEILTAINLDNQEIGKNFSEPGFKKCNRIVKRKYFKKIDIKMVTGRIHVNTEYLPIIQWGKKS